MATYTGIADANGDFSIPFSASYTGGQKVTVTSERDSAVKTIELFAPSETTGAMMQFSGTTVNFPLNIGDVTIKMSGKLQDYSFSGFSTATQFNQLISKVATSIKLIGCTELGKNAFEYSNVKINDILSSPTLTTIGEYAFTHVQLAQTVNIPAGKTWGIYVFDSALITEATFQSGVTIIPIGMFYQCASLEKISIPATVTEIQGLAFASCSKLSVITVLATTPPVITSDSLQSIKSTCIIKVPAASVAAYKAAPNWSAFASRIKAI
ncbi:leucine-rich repeat domain-containing protein [Acinetobacter ursingii]|uniref:leucine-rich repeat domain-containing protein n=1 Tax=Acinetobacter ursingii TaxID=108980 RepID=UPI00124D6F3E|nr:leucine-rich repeat domain-containing protein [Acinetobacter ursingii]